MRSHDERTNARIVEQKQNIFGWLAETTRTVISAGTASTRRSRSKSSLTGNTRIKRLRGLRYSNDELLFQHFQCVSDCLTVG